MGRTFGTLQGVGGGGSDLLAALFAEPAVEAAELGTDIGAGAPGGVGAENLIRAR